MAHSHGMKRILIFVESNEESILAAQYAIWLAKITGAEIAALYVVDTKTLDDLLRARIFVRMEEMDYERDLEEDGRRYLNHVRDLAEAKGVTISTSLEKGEVHSIVTEKAREIEADLLVLGEREVPLSRKDCYFDEAQRILSEIRCPVLMVKGGENIRELYENIP